jgi:tRNA (cytidine/uridine-2'-O-)-methyltransferase
VKHSDIVPHKSRTAATAGPVPPRRPPVRLALYQPDIAANTGAALRLAACLDVPVEVIEPCGFPFDRVRLRRAGLDYLERVRLTRHASWPAFESWRASSGLRLLLLTTRGRVPHHRCAFRPGDVLLAGRESAGVPEEVHAAADLTLRVPMAAGLRSLNVVTALAIVLGEALRQLDAFPLDPEDPT